MKIIGHRQRESDLQNQRNHQELTTKESNAACAYHEQQCRTTANEALQSADNHPQIKPKLHQCGR